MTLMTVGQDNDNADSASGGMTTMLGGIPVVTESTEQAAEQQYRVGTWSLLAALLRAVPDEALLAHTAGLSQVDAEGDELAKTMSLLGLAAKHCAQPAVDDEYHALFIGLGRGEVVPYGSWYLTGFLMEKPLGQLRNDLVRLGFERDPAVKEPEDHVAALCEVMAMLIAEGCSVAVQAKFFSQHMSRWLDRFFDDLTQAESASFYQAVARFGAAFIAFERQYFGLEIQE